MSTCWLKMGKISDKMKQDGAKMRNMRDLPSVCSPLWVATTVRNLPTTRRARALGRGRGGVNPSPRIGGDWFRRVLRKLIYTH